MGVPQGSISEGLVKYMQGVYGTPSCDKGYCLRTVNRGLQKLGLPQLGETAGGNEKNGVSETGRLLSARFGAAQIWPSSRGSLEQLIMPGDIVVYKQGHRNYGRQPDGHVGIYVIPKGKQRLYSNLNGKMKTSPLRIEFNPERIEVWRLGSAQDIPRGKAPSKREPAGRRYVTDYSPLYGLPGVSIPVAYIGKNTSVTIDKRVGDQVRVKIPGGAQLWMSGSRLRQ